MLAKEQTTYNNNARKNMQSKQMIFLRYRGFVQLNSLAKRFTVVSEYIIPELTLSIFNKRSTTQKLITTVLN